MRMIWHHDSILQTNKQLMPWQCTEITVTLEAKKLEPKLLLRNFGTFQYSEITEENQILIEQTSKKQITYVIAWHSACESYLLGVSSKCMHQNERWPLAIARKKRNANNEWEGWASLEVIIICLFALRPPPCPLASGTKSRPEQLTEWLALTYWRLSVSSSNYYLPLRLAAAAQGPAGPTGACQWHWVQTPEPDCATLYWTQLEVWIAWGSVTVSSESGAHDRFKVLLFQVDRFEIHIMYDFASSAYTNWGVCIFCIWVIFLCIFRILKGGVYIGHII